MEEKEKEKEVLEEEQADASAGGGEPGADSGAPEEEEQQGTPCGDRDAGDQEAEDKAAGEEEASTGSEDSPEGKEPLTGRKARKQAKADKKAEGYREQIAQLEDRVKRQLAEFENFRNRTDKEKQAMFETGAKSVIEKILPVVDNFERGLATVPEDKKEDPFVDGMNRIYRQLLTELENIGVRPIEAVGREFDPNLHNAVMQVESEEYESGVVAQELQKGYTYHDSVVRHSMVAVAT
ncbi:MAG: nucleotide exchange factor GrpE [Butyrivibrio sp.]|nr:nucleotide exchange factor GrpE [Acetatifactor muris]MCM1560987.1 nucleotide exchange factor GrpE [Butyrivibrio sp.]